MAYYYPATIAEARRTLDANGVDSGGQTARRGHLYWMCKQIDGFDPYSLNAALKAARWIGWILAGIEEIGYWQNDRSRELVRADVLHERDRPLQQG